MGGGSNHPAAEPPQRRRDRFLQLLKPQSRSPSPNPPSSSIQPAPSPPITVLHQAVSAPHAPSTGRSTDLWTKAYDKLPEELKQDLGLNGAVDKLQDILQMAIEAKEANMGNRLKLKWGAKEVDVQDTADRLVGWITKFKEVGDIAVQCDPVHAGLPWAGVRFILLVRTTIHSLTLIFTKR